VSKKIAAIVLPSGGTKGVISTKLFDDFISRVEQKAIEQGKEFTGIPCNYFAGTSIGSFIGGATVCELMPKSVLSIFRENAGKMLKKSSLLPIKDPYYSSKNLEEILDKVFEEKKFNDIDKKILITSYNLDTASETIFSNFGDEISRRKLPGYVWDIDKIRLKDAVHASCAVPGIFLSKKIKYARNDEGVKKYHEVDGAMQNISPLGNLIVSMKVLENIDFKDMFILSFGTGVPYPDIVSHLKNEGFANHIKNVKEIGIAHLYAVANSMEKQYQTLINSCGGEFFNFNPQMSVEQFSLALNSDSPKQIESYVEIAAKYIEDNDALLDQIAQKFVDCCL
jgi:hypothetical protein